MTKPVSAICEQQRHRSACASVLSDQYLVASIQFFGPMQTVQTQIRCRKTRHLIRVYTVYLQEFSWEIKNENIHPTPLKLEMDSAY